MASGGRMALGSRRRRWAAVIDDAIKVLGLITAHRSMMAVIAFLALHWQRVDRFLKFATP